jgi:hypothetical protein
MLRCVNTERRAATTFSLRAFGTVWSRFPGEMHTAAVPAAALPDSPDRVDQPLWASLMTSMTPLSPRYLSEPINWLQ